jgi:hypothetical protein
MLEECTNDGRLIAALAHSEELDIFNSRAVQALIEFKWKNYAQAKQCLGATIHICYVFTLIAYIQRVYLSADKGAAADHYLLAALGTLLLYPVANDGTRVLRIGSAYFAAPGNYVDLL